MAQPGQSQPLQKLPKQGKQRFWTMFQIPDADQLNKAVSQAPYRLEGSAIAKMFGPQLK